MSLGTSYHLIVSTFFCPQLYMYFLSNTSFSLCVILHTKIINKIFIEHLWQDKHYFANVSKGNKMLYWVPIWKKLFLFILAPLSLIISDLLGMKMVSFLYSITSCPGILIPSSTPRGRNHCRDSVFSTLFTIYHSHMICQTILLSALTNRGFLG